jgi:hypothetical protein
MAHSVEKGVFVIGMDRSGTSAVTGLLRLLGLRTPLNEDLVQARNANPKGVWESESLVAFNRRLLTVVGSDERFPLALERGWENDSRLDPLRQEAPEAFQRSFPNSPWVWKDPLLCLTFAFWRSALAVRPVVVLVNRNPLEVAASALRAWGRPKIYGLALWEHYLRQALDQIAGLPVLVTNYEDLVSAPLAWCEQTHGFLNSAGVPVHREQERDALSFVDTRLKHLEFTRADVLGDRDVSGPQRELFVALEHLVGGHELFALPALEDETPTTEALFAERRQTFRLKGELERQLAIERQSRWWPRALRSKYLSPARRVYRSGRRVFKALAAAGGLPSADAQGR